MAMGCPACRALRRKRVVISKDVSGSPLHQNGETPLKKRLVLVYETATEGSRLEALPQDVLVRVLCSVEHEDLKQLFHVSKAIREATVIAKQCHFGYSTPTKKSRLFQTWNDLEEFDEIEAPKAPLRPPKSRFVNRSKLAAISCPLFASMDDETCEFAVEERPTDTY